MERMPDVKHEPLVNGFVEPVKVLEILDRLRINAIAVGQIERTAGGERHNDKRHRNHGQERWNEPEDATGRITHHERDSPRVGATIEKLPSRNDPATPARNPTLGCTYGENA